MTKTQLTKIIRQNAEKQIEIYQNEIKEWSDDEMIFRLEGKIQGIKEFLINLQALKIIN